MHSSTLRGGDFQIVDHGRAVDHAAFFDAFRIANRLGVVTHEPDDGAGAVTLVMAYVTAFYDLYRATGESFCAYPDFYVFRRGGAPADYAMLDIHPGHKWVMLPEVGDGPLTTITDRAASVLLVPDGTPAEHDYSRVARASAKRSIRECYAYTFNGRTAEADLTVRCAKEPITDWTVSMFDSLRGEGGAAQRKAEWLALYEDAADLEQSFRRVSLDEALGLL